MLTKVKKRLLFEPTRIEFFCSQHSVVLRISKDVYQKRLLFEPNRIAFFVVIIQLFFGFSNLFLKVYICTAINNTKTHL